MRERQVGPGEALLAGVVAWLAMVAYWYAVGPSAGIRLGGISAYAGSLLTGRPGGFVTEWAGRALLLAVAAAWGLAYRGVRGALVGAEWARGLVYGVGVWLASGLVLFPLLDAVHPLAGAAGVGRAGLFGFGFAGPGGAVLSLAGHALFGLTLGLYVDARLRSRGVAPEPVDPGDPGRPDQDS